MTIQRWTLRTWAMATVAGFLPYAAARAQDSGCTYEACALRLRSGVMSSSVVAGAAEIKASRSSFGGLRIPALATAGDSARIHYQAYRRVAPRVAVYGLAAGLASAAGLFIADSKHRTLSVVLVSTSMVGGMLAAIEGARARDQLQRAIWHYNFGVAGGGVPSALAGPARED